MWKTTVPQVEEHLLFLLTSSGCDITLKKVLNSGRETLKRVTARNETKFIISLPLATANANILAEDHACKKKTKEKKNLEQTQYFVCR